jgi:hypothetical protein
VSEEAIRLRWTRVNSATGYEIHRYNINKKRYTRVKTINSSSKTLWVNRDLKSNRVYKYKLRAFRKIDGKTVYSDFTYSVSAITNSASYKKVNADSIESAKSIDVGINEKLTIEGKALPSRKNRKSGKKALSSHVRLMVTASGHARKDSEGRLVGEMPGNANAYLMAHNGYKKQLRVRVVDYAKPAKWVNLHELDSFPAKFLKDYKEEITAIASYFSMHRVPKTSTIFYDSNRDFIYNHGNVDLSEIEDKINNITVSFPLNFTIEIYSDGSVKYCIASPDSELENYMIVFDTLKNFSKKEADEHDLSRIAPHWVYWKEIGSGI